MALGLPTRPSTVQKILSGLCAKLIRIVFNYLGLNGGWFARTLGAANARPWLGVGLLAIYLDQ